MHASPWSLLPFLIVIPIALFTRQVLPGLMTGLLVGAYMMHPSVLGGISATLHYILTELAVPDNLRLVVFLYGFGAFVGLVRVTGGVSGFAKFITKRLRSPKSAFAVTWVSSIATFMAPDFRIITVAPVMKDVFSRLSVPIKKVAYVIDLTSTPMVAIVPIGTAFVGYMVGLLQTESRHYGVSKAVAASPYHLFLQTIPLNFFSLTMLALGLIQTFWRFSPRRSDKSAKAQSDTGQDASERRRPHSVERGHRIGYAPAEVAEELTPSSNKGAPGETQGKSGAEPPDPVETISESVPPRVWNLVFPLGLLLALTLFLTWWNGHTKSPTLFGALASADASTAMLNALLITLVVMVLWYVVQRQPMHRTMFGFLAGGNEMMGVILLLSLVWAVSAVSTDLGFTTYTERTIGHLVPSALIAPALFVFGCAISYVIGSSFGTWGMLLPLGFSLAQSTHASIALVAGAVFASGTFGGFTSPLSDNTVAMATVMKLPVMDYARYKLVPGLVAAGVSTVAYGVVGWLAPGIA